MPLSTDIAVTTGLQTFLDFLGIAAPTWRVDVPEATII
jgi:hypothetical protein